LLRYPGRDRETQFYRFDNDIFHHLMDAPNARSLNPSLRPGAEVETTYIGSLPAAEERLKGTNSVKSHTIKEAKSAASGRRTPAYGIVSDDVTGGLLVASYFEEAGIVCPVYFDPAVAKKDRPSDGIVVIVTRSRLEPVPEARRQIAAALDALDAIGCESIGYKVCGTFDSTEQGNIGPAAYLIAERYNQTPLLISGGFVEYGITVYNGHMFIRNDLISESRTRPDPITPMSDPNLVRFLSLQTKMPVGLITHAELSKSNNAASDAVTRLVNGGYKHIMHDATGEDDLRASIFLTKKAKAIVGSDSFIIYFGMDRAMERRGKAAPPGTLTVPQPCSSAAWARSPASNWLSFASTIPSSI
jgi:hypothetical protein